LFITYKRGCQSKKINSSSPYAEMRETSYLTGKCSGGSPPSEAHGGGWEGLGWDGGEPPLYQIKPSFLTVKEIEMLAVYLKKLTE
jgi:hypothetical protein